MTSALSGARALPVRAHLGAVAAALHGAPAAVVRARLVAEHHAAIVGVAASDATLGRLEIRDGLAREGREGLRDADATRTGLSAPAVERGWDVGCRREEVERVDVIGSRWLAVGSGDVEPREGAAQDER